MRKDEVVIIIGAGLAGHSAAEALRSEGFSGRVLLVGEEPRQPYDRPPLSKEFLKGQWTEERLYFKSIAGYEEQRIELRLNTRVEGVDTEKQLVLLTNHEQIHYDYLLLAVGGYPKRLSIPGGDLRGIHYLRTLDDSNEISKVLKPGAKLVVVGGGFIGCEVAAAARTRNVDVTLLEALPLPMAQAFGPEIGEFYAAEHRAHGVDLRLSEGVSEFVGRDEVESVVSAGGNPYACTAVVVGIGITPAIEFLRNTTIALDGGILVDEYCRTSVPGVYAVGDAANWWHPVLKRRIRVEHWDHAAKQAVVAARNILGANEIYCPVPYFWSDQYDLRLQLYGYIPKDKKVRFVIRGSYDERSFNVFYYAGRRLLAAVSVNRPKDARAAIKLIESGVEIEPLQLADPSVDIKGMVKSSA
jgi:3-phenylpropionate/trans-cinnamate dioxygenase ferredoxin reductase component